MLQPGASECSPCEPLAHARQYVVNMQGGWECRRTLQNVLRVLWLDVFERAGWTVASATNFDHGGISPGAAASGPKDVAGFKGECTNFVLYKNSASTAMFAHDIERRECPIPAYTCPFMCVSVA